MRRVEGIKMPFGWDGVLGFRFHRRDMKVRYIFTVWYAIGVFDETAGRLMRWLKLPFKR